MFSYLSTLNASPFSRGMRVAAAIFSSTQASTPSWSIMLDRNVPWCEVCIAVRHRCELMSTGMPPCRKRRLLLGACPSECENGKASLIIVLRIDAPSSVLKEMCLVRGVGRKRAQDKSGMMDGLVHSASVRRATPANGAMDACLVPRLGKGWTPNPLNPQVIIRFHQARARPTPLTYVGPYSACRYSKAIMCQPGSTRPHL